MRKRNQNAYKNRAYYFEKTYKAANVVEYSSIGVMFKFNNYEGRKSTIEREQRVIDNEFSGRTIETVSPLPFKTDDKIEINGVEAFIEKIEIKSDLSYGAIRNRPNRNITIITLS